MDWVIASKMILAFALLLLASWADWKSREVSDAYWALLGVAGMVFLAIQIRGDAADPTFYLMLIPIAVFFLDIFWERRGILEDGVNPVPLALYAIAFAILAWLVLGHYEDPYLWKLMLIPVMFLVFILLYQFDIIKGGADAKALIALTILFPLYPRGDCFPLIPIPPEVGEIILPFPLILLFNAALISLVVPLALFILNLLRRDIELPTMFLGYRMPLDEIGDKFVWPMERIVNGEKKIDHLHISSDDAVRQLEGLRAAGVKTIWVTPKVPFLIPITISVLLTTLIGNPLFLLFQ